MKSMVVGLVWLVGGYSSLWAGAPSTIELKGIVQFPANERNATIPGTQRDATGLVALIGWQATSPQPWEQSAMLGVGERQGDLEVLKIDPATGTVQVKMNGEPRELMLPTANVPKQTIPHTAAGQVAPASSGSIRLVNASWREALQIYQQLVGRTLLMSGRVRQANKLTLVIDQPVPTEDLTKAIEGALEGLLFHSDGDKFTVVGREGDFEKLTPELHELARKLTPKTPVPPGGHGAETTTSETDQKEEMVPAGMLSFRNTDFSQFLMIFQELVNRTLLRSAAFPSPGIYLKTQTPLTREEANYAMCAVLALDGISLVDLGDKFLFAYPSVLEAKRKELFARKLPSHESAKTQTLPAGMVNASFDLSAVARVYAELSGQPVELDQDLPPRRLFLHSQTPLMAADVLYAFDLLLGWEGLEVVKNKDGTGLRLTRIQ